MIECLKNTLLGQLRGRRIAWTFAFVTSSVLLAIWFYMFWPTCDLMFYPREVVQDYATAWVWLFLLIGLTNRGKALCALVLVLWLVVWHDSLVEYRVPTNQRRAVYHLREMQEKIQAAKGQIGGLNEVSPAMGANGQLSGYQFSLSRESNEGTVLTHYNVTAGPQCYCRTGQMSFVLADNGVIHYTLADRAATLVDPIVKPN